MLDKHAASSADTRMERTLLKPEEITATLPEGLLARIIAHLDPIRVFVFGSRAHGMVHQDSDWDLLVIVDDDIAPERIGWRGVHEARRGIHGAIDLVPLRESNYRRREKIIGSLPWIVNSEGVLVYERQKRT